MDEDLTVQCQRKGHKRRRVLCSALLLLATLLVLLVLFIILAFATKGFGLWEDTGCHTKQCVHAASRILHHMDQTADPCVDFYQYACGNYDKVHVIEPGKNSRSTFDDLRTEQFIKLNKLLETDNEQDPDYVKQAKNFYKSCMNESVINEKGIEPLKDYIQSLGGWSVLDKNVDLSDFQFEEYWVKLGTETYYPAYANNIFGIGTRADPDNYQKRIISLYQVSLGMGRGTRENYLNGRSDKLVEAYEKMINNIVKLLGSTDMNYSKNEVAKVVDFEIELARINLKPEEMRDSANNSRTLSVGELTRLYNGGVDWKRVMSKMFEKVDIDVKDDDRVFVGMIPFIEKLGDLIKKTDSKTLAGYLMWGNVQRTLLILDKKTREIYREFTAEKTGITTEGPRYKLCTSKTKTRFPMVCARIFADEFFTGSTAGMEDLTKRVKKAFKHRLKEADWLDNESRKNAIEKIDAMVAQIAYPKYLKDDEKLKEKTQEYGFGKMQPEEYFANTLDTNRKHTLYSLGQLTEPVDRDEWWTSPVTVNAFYMRMTNSMTYPLGILYPPFYDNGGLKALNFGAIGEVIGHEITHGFDDSGRLYDKHGNKIEWMTQASVDRFKSKAQCVVDTYNNITVEQIGEKVNGLLTQGENIADIGGIAQAFVAYQSWVRENGQEKRLPGLALTPNQLFFVGYGQVGCRLAKAKSLKLQVRSDSHTPDRERVLGALYNTKEFADVFNCPVGSPMNPKHKCRVW